MGIHGFNPFMKKYHKLPEKDRYLSDFRGKRIAVDMHNIIYKQMYGAQKRMLSTTDVVLFGADRTETLRNWLSMVLDLVISFLEHGVTPILVFDGVSVHEKSPTKKKRKNDTVDKINRIKEIEQEILKYDPISVPKSLADELRKLHGEVVYVSQEEQEYIRNILSSIGIPVVQAVSEAEKLCSMLTIEGMCEATYSTDTDNYALGCPLVITKMDKRLLSDKGIYDRRLTTVSLVDILTILDMTYETFVDLCIAGGNDFNDNIPNYALKKAYDDLKKCKSIENLPEKKGKKGKTQLDTGILNYKTTREIFKVQPWKDCYVSGAIDLPDCLPEEARDVLESVGKEFLLPRLSNAIKGCPKGKDRGWPLKPQQRRLIIKKSQKVEEPMEREELKEIEEDGK